MSQFDEGHQESRLPDGSMCEEHQGLDGQDDRHGEHKMVCTKLAKDGVVFIIVDIKLGGGHKIGSSLAHSQQEIQSYLIFVNFVTLSHYLGL